MDSNVDFARDLASAEVSFVQGGALYRAEKAARLVQQNRWDVAARVGIFVGVCWLPLLLITLIFNTGATQSFFTDYRVQARALLAVPALLIGEIIMDARFRDIFSYLRRGELLDAVGTAYMDRIAANLVRIRDSFVPELVILILIYVRLALRYRDLVDATPWLARGSGMEFHFTAAGWYSLLVSAPIFTFLLILALWRWLLWTFFAFKLSRQDLRLLPTHPDERGGLNFLSLSISAFAPVAFAAAIAIASTWRHNVLRHGAQIMDFKLDALVFTGIIVVIALGPLFLFVPLLARLRRRGTLEYGILGQMQSTEFPKSWAERDPSCERPSFLTSEVSSLAGFGTKVEKIGSLLPFPADKESLYPLVVALGIPALTVVLAEIPFGVVVEDLFKPLR